MILGFIMNKRENLQANKDWLEAKSNYALSTSAALPLKHGLGVSSLSC